jgi:hypothetical protein
MKPAHARAGLLVLTLAVALGPAVHAEETGRQWRASQIVGMRVQSPAGELLAEVKDIVMDSKGVATHLVLSYGGTLGAGAKLLAVPWSAATAMVDGDRLLVSRSRLMAAPTFADGKWPDLASGSWSLDADRYWQTPDPSLQTDTTRDAEVSPHRSRARPQRD